MFVVGLTLGVVLVVYLVVGYHLWSPRMLFAAFLVVSYALWLKCEDLGWKLNGIAKRLKLIE